MLHACFQLGYAFSHRQIDLLRADSLKGIKLTHKYYYRNIDVGATVIVKWLKESTRWLYT
jgi:hypothetical protein